MARATAATMVADVVERDLGGVGKTEHDHAERIADEEHGHAGLVKQPRGGIVVGGQRGNFFAARLGLGDPVGRDFLHA